MDIDNAFMYGNLDEEVYETSTRFHNNELKSCMSTTKVVVILSSLGISKQVFKFL